MPILIGDLAQYDKRRWRVKSYDRQVRVCQLVSWEGETVEVADNAEAHRSSTQLGAKLFVVD